MALEIIIGEAHLSETLRVQYVIASTTSFSTTKSPCWNFAPASWQNTADNPFVYGETTENRTYVRWSLSSINTTPERITVLLPEEEKMNEDAREAFSKLSQSADDFLNILAKAATHRQDIFFALSLFESMCDTTAHLDKLSCLVEMYRMVKDVEDSKIALATNNANSAETNDPPQQPPL